MRETCRIQWLDSDGNATPDNNEAIGRVRLEARVVQIGGIGVPMAASVWFPICAEHAKRLRERGMEHWTFEATNV